jgi:hypothetical protein
MVYSTPLEFMIFYWWDLSFKTAIHFYFAPYDFLGRTNTLDSIFKFNN